MVIIAFFFIILFFLACKGTKNFPNNHKKLQNFFTPITLTVIEGENKIIRSGEEKAECYLYVTC